MGLLSALLGDDSDGGKPLSLTGTTAPAAPTFQDRFNNPLTQVGLQLLANNGRPATEGAFNGVPEALARSAKAQEKNKTLEWLKVQHPDIFGYVKAGMDPGEAFLYALKRDEAAKAEKRQDANDAFARGKFEWEQKQGNAELDLRRQTLDASNTTADMKEYRFATENGFGGSFYDWQTKKAQAAAGGGGFGLNPIYGRRADGSIGVGQLGKDGSLVESRLPDGFQPLSPEELNFGKASGTAGGKSQGENRAGLPGAEKDAAYAVAKIDELLNDKNLGSATGVESLFPSWAGGTAAGIDARIEQVKGQTFLQAFSSLKGAGAITDVEGQKATDAIARLNKAQSDADFKLALSDLREVIKNGLNVIRQKAGAGAAPSAGGGGGQASSGVNWSIEP